MYLRLQVVQIDGGYLGSVGCSCRWWCFHLAVVRMTMPIAFRLPMRTRVDKTFASHSFRSPKLTRCSKERLLQIPLEDSVKEVNMTCCTPCLDFTLLSSWAYFAILASCACSRSLRFPTTCASITYAVGPFFTMTSGFRRPDYVLKCGSLKAFAFSF